MAGASFQVWIGDEAGWNGCGVIVDSQHVVTCNHVVRQSLPGFDLYGGSANDLVGKRVAVRFEIAGNQEQEVEMEVVGNHPLPADEPGKFAFDDLCLLKTVSPGIHFASFAELVVGDLSSGGPFVGQGIAVRTQPLGGYVSKPFEGEIRPRAHFAQWYFTFEPDELMQSHPGFSGAAVQMPDKSRIYGLLQGCLVKQVGYFIPATSISEFLQQNGVEAQHFDLSKPFKSMFQPARLDLTKDMLKLCDRDDQTTPFDKAKRTFLANLFDHEGSRLFAFGIGGQDVDMPDLLHHRLGPNGIQSYKEVRRLKLKEPHDVQRQHKFSAFKIGLEYDEPAAENLQNFVIDKIASTSTADGALLVGLADEAVIIDALRQFDTAVLFVIYCPQHLFNSAMASAWTDCLARIAALLHNHHPIIAVMVVTLDADNPEVPTLDDDDFLLLPLLGELNCGVIGPWISRVRPGDSASHKAILDQVGKVFGDRAFRMKELQDALFPDEDSQLGVIT